MEYDNENKIVESKDFYRKNIREKIDKIDRIDFLLYLNRLIEKIIEDGK